VPYDPDAEATRFNRFLDEIFYGDPDKFDKKRLVMELIGYTLLSTCRYEKFAILIGSGANGKSVLLEVIKALCGIDNVAAVQPEQMAKAFQRAYLLGKLANLVTEIAEGAVINDAALKAVTSGEYMTAERKYRDPFSFAPFATCWFGTNHMPHTRDFSDALFRRACILTFNNKFEGANCDPHLKAALLTELPGILNMALHAIGCVFQLEEFTMPASSVDARAEWRIEADQVRQFVEECCQLGGGQENNEDLYEAYELWTKEAGISRPLKKISFLKRLTRLGPEPGRSSSARYYSGITLINRPSPPYFYARK
jgi:P4 family phage/plasmid primase-like protien